MEAGERFDIVLFGATGFTGKLTIPELHKLCQGLKWAVAGRSKEKLCEVLKEASLKTGRNSL